jgi:hypothetical protein
MEIARWKLVSTAGLADLVREKRMPRIVLARRPSLSRRIEQADHQLYRRDSQVDEWQDRDIPG